MLEKDTALRRARILTNHAISFEVSHLMDSARKSGAEQVIVDLANTTRNLEIRRVLGRKK